MNDETDGSWQGEVLVLSVLAKGLLFVFLLKSQRELRQYPTVHFNQVNAVADKGPKRHAWQACFMKITSQWITWVWRWRMGRVAPRGTVVLVVTQKNMNFSPFAFCVYFEIPILRNRDYASLQKFQMTHTLVIWRRHQQGPHMMPILNHLLKVQWN